MTVNPTMFLIGMVLAFTIYGGVMLGVIVRDGIENVRRTGRR